MPASTRRRRRLPRRRGSFGPLLIAGLAVVVAVGAWQLLHPRNSQAARTAQAAISPAHPTASPAIDPPKPAGGGRIAVNDPALHNGLTQQACIAFPPRGADLHRTVFIDPGHGGPDPGATGTRADGSAINEKDATLAVGLALSDKLRADGYRVVLSRTADVSVAALTADQVHLGAITNTAARLDQLARIACANAAHADVLLSIHFNAFDDPSAGGAETFYDDARDFAAANHKLATLLQQSMIASFRHGGWDTYDRGIWSDADTGASGLTQQGESYGRLLILGPASPGWLDHPSAMPGALVEPLFITDPAEGEALAGSEGRGIVAAGLEQGLVGFLQTAG